MNFTKINQIQNAFIIYVNIKSFDQRNNLENSFDEFKSLVLSSGLTIKEQRDISQNTPIINTFLSKGKLEDLKQSISQDEIDIVVINHELSASQTRNLEKLSNSAKNPTLIFSVQKLSLFI